MKIFDKKLFLHVYFLLQCPTVVINFFVFIISIILTGIIIIFSYNIINAGIFKFLLYCTLAIICILMFFTYFLITIISVKATFKLCYNKPITNIEKICTKIYAIITIPIYAILIYKNPLLLLIN